MLKTSLSRGGAFMEEQIFPFPLPVEKRHTEFVQKMNSFPCCLFWMLYWGKVKRYHSMFFLHQKIPPGVFAFVLPLQAGKHTCGHVGPPVCPLPCNCHGALATKWFCGKWSVGIRVGPSICYKSQVLWACWFAELISKNCWSPWLLWVMLAVHSEEYSTGPMKLQLMKWICLFLVRFEWHVVTGDRRRRRKSFQKPVVLLHHLCPPYPDCWAEPLVPLPSSTLPRRGKNFTFHCCMWVRVTPKWAPELVRITLKQLPCFNTESAY